MPHKIVCVVARAAAYSAHAKAVFNPNILLDGSVLSS
jgi:hypothetical protein